MADLTISPSDVQPVLNVRYKRRANSNYIAGVDIDAGEVCYVDENDVAQLASGAATAVEAADALMALSTAVAGQPVDLALTGRIAVGIVLTKGTFYYVSAANPGKIAPHADLTSGQFVTQVGYAYDGSHLELNRLATGVTV